MGFVAGCRAGEGVSKSTESSQVTGVDMSRDFAVYSWALDKRIE